jgi:hypothetical protein
MAELDLCYNGPENSPTTNARRAAEKATRPLDAKPGTPEWNKAKEVVLAYVKVRQRQRVCIDRADNIARSSLVLSRADRRALGARVSAYTVGWAEWAIFETIALARLLDQPTAEEIDKMGPVNLYAVVSCAVRAAN